METYILYREASYVELLAMSVLSTRGIVVGPSPTTVEAVRVN